MRYSEMFDEIIKITDQAQNNEDRIIILNACINYLANKRGEENGIEI